MTHAKTPSDLRYIKGKKGTKQSIVNTSHNETKRENIRSFANIRDVPVIAFHVHPLEFVAHPFQHHAVEGAVIGGPSVRPVCVRSDRGAGLKPPPRPLHGKVRAPDPVPV